MSGLTVIPYIPAHYKYPFCMVREIRTIGNPGNKEVEITNTIVREESSAGSNMTHDKTL